MTITPIVFSSIYSMARWGLMQKRVDSSTGTKRICMYRYVNKGSPSRLEFGSPRRRSILRTSRGRLGHWHQRRCWGGNSPCLRLDEQLASAFYGKTTEHDGLRPMQLGVNGESTMQRYDGTHDPPVAVPIALQSFGFFHKFATSNRAISLSSQRVTWM